MSKGRRKGQTTGRREPAVDIRSAGPDKPAGPELAAVPDPEVAAKPTRRQFTAQYKLRILREAESQRELGAIGTLLRREGLYSTHLTTWRRERDRGALESLGARRRGRKADPAAEWRQQIATLETENQRLHERLRQAEAIIAAQKKLAEILGLPGSPPAARESA